jgi:hypothetical protein
VEQAAEDYQQRYYGAAQFQVVFDCDASSPPPAERLDEIFATLIGTEPEADRNLDFNVVASSNTFRCIRAVAFVGSAPMSRDMQLYGQPSSYGSNLPVAQDEFAHQTTALGMPGAGGNTAPPPPSPMKKIQRLLRGREKLAITLGLCGAIVGGLVGWFSQKPQWISSGTVWIRPIIPRLLDSDKVMPFYTQYIQSQCAILVGPRVLDRAVQSNDWKATGLPSNSDMAALLKQNLDVSSPKNSQHIMVTYTDERLEVAHAAVRSVIHAYESIYSDANGRR